MASEAPDAVLILYVKIEKMENVGKKKKRFEENMYLSAELAVRKLG
jgi:hypothetical protein